MLLVIQDLAIEKLVGGMPAPVLGLPNFACSVLLASLDLIFLSHEPSYCGEIVPDLSFPLLQHHLGF